MQGSRGQNREPARKVGIGCKSLGVVGTEGWVWEAEGQGSQAPGPVGLIPSAVPRIPLGPTAGPHPAPGPDAAGGPRQHHPGGKAICSSTCPGSRGAHRTGAEPWHRAPPPRQDPDFAEVLSELSARELQWLVQGQLRIVAETEGQHARQLVGTITARRSCDSEHGAGTLGHRGGGRVSPPMPTSPPPFPPRASLPGLKPSKVCCVERTPCCRPRRGPWARPSWHCMRMAPWSTR